MDRSFFRDNVALIKKTLESRFNSKIDLQKIAALDKDLKELEIITEKILAERNSLSKKIPSLMKENNKKEVEKISSKVSALKRTLEINTNKISLLSNQLEEMISFIPNVLDVTVPIGENETKNLEVLCWGEINFFSFKPLAHWDLGLINDLVDFERATKITGSRFVTYKKNGARLLRALQKFTLDVHIKNGYSEFLPQVVVNSSSLFGTGQLPKFEDDLFKLNNNFFLSPTGEVQLTNLYANEIIDDAILPLKFVASTINFRAEAGSAGRDTRGVIRQHQFYKTELVKIVLPEHSNSEHESMVADAESILKMLVLPYRKVLLCSGDTGFSASKTYDLEVWLPSYNDYKEISSCSNCKDFQSKRLKIRSRSNLKEKARSVHTLNGSGVALDRLWAAIIENYQLDNGKIKIPDVLIPYMDGLKEI